MENLMLGLKVAAIGIVGVFAVLLILMGAIKGFEYLIEAVSKKAHAKQAVSAPAVSAPQASAPVAVATEDESEVVAVITAAIMAILQSENAGNMPSFTIKKIKQIKRN